MTDSQENPSVIVMKELGDLKEKLATNTANTANVLDLVKGLKDDISKYSAMFVTHEEFKSFGTSSEDHEIRIRELESKVWRAIGALTIAQIIILPVVLYLFYKTIA